MAWEDDHYPRESSASHGSRQGRSAFGSRSSSGRLGRSRAYDIDSDDDPYSYLNGDADAEDDAEEREAMRDALGYGGRESGTSTRAAWSMGSEDELGPRDRRMPERRELSRGPGARRQEPIYGMRAHREASGHGRTDGGRGGISGMLGGGRSQYTAREESSKGSGIGSYGRGTTEYSSYGDKLDDERRAYMGGEERSRPGGWGSYGSNLAPCRGCGGLIHANSRHAVREHRGGRSRTALGGPEEGWTSRDPYDPYY